MDGQVGAIPPGSRRRRIRRYADPRLPRRSTRRRSTVPSARPPSRRPRSATDPAIRWIRRTPEALREVALDVEEGRHGHGQARLPYLDVLKAVKDRSACPRRPTRSRRVAMIKAAAAKGWIDERRSALESRRPSNAPARTHPTYYAPRSGRNGSAGLDGMSRRYILWYYHVQEPVLETPRRGVPGNGNGGPSSQASAQCLYQRGGGSLQSPPSTAAARRSPRPESAAVRDESLRVLAEFERIEDAPSGLR